jgi:hypothetical protein
LQRPLETTGLPGNSLSDVIHKGNILKEEGPGFVRGMQTRDRGIEIEVGPE